METTFDLEAIRNRVYDMPIRDWGDGVASIDVPDFEAMCAQIRTLTANVRYLQGRLEARDSGESRRGVARGGRF